MEHKLVLPSPVGELTLIEENGALTGLYFGTRPGGEEGPSPLLEEAARQLRAYFAGQRQAFSLPLAPRGTAFQLQVWQALQTIPLWGGAHLWGDCPGHRQAQGLPGGGHGQPQQPHLHHRALPPGGGGGRLPHRLRRGPGGQGVFAGAGAGRPPIFFNLDIERRLGRGTNPPAFSVQIAALPRARGRVTVGKDFAPRGQEERTVPMRKTNVSHTITRRETAR